MYFFIYCRGVSFSPTNIGESSANFLNSMWNSVTTENDVHCQPPCDEQNMRRISGVDLMRIIHNYWKII